MEKKKRKFASQEKAIISATWSLVVPFDENRVALILPGDSASNLWWSFREAAPAVASFHTSQYIGPVMLTKEDHGDLVCGPFYVFRAAGATTIIYWQATEAPG